MRHPYSGRSNISLHSLPCVALSCGAYAQDPTEGEEALNMQLVGYDDLQGRSAYQPIVHQQGDRWIAYIGHHAGLHENPLTGEVEGNGTSILDVTDPANPQYLFHIPGGEEESEAQMVRMCEGSDLPDGIDGNFYLLRAVGRNGHQVWDVTTPENPSMVSWMEAEGLVDTHKNWWECDTGIAYLVSGVEGWAPRRMTQVYDLSDPAEPRFIRNFGLPGQQPGAPNHEEMSQYELHGPIAVGNRIYFGYGTFLNGVVQIIDRERLIRGNPALEDPFEPTDENLEYPVINTMYTGPGWARIPCFPCSAWKCRNLPTTPRAAPVTCSLWSANRCATNASKTAR